MKMQNRCETIKSCRTRHSGEQVFGRGALAGVQPAKRLRPTLIAPASVASKGRAGRGWGNRPSLGHAGRTPARVVGALTGESARLNSLACLLLYYFTA